MNFCEPPHSGYHWDHCCRRFFEGWYFRVSLPELRRNFAFMYSIEDPLGGESFSGGAVQIMGLGDEYLWRTLPNSDTFWADHHRLALGHWRHRLPNLAPQLLAPECFATEVGEGYQATMTLNQGQIKDPASGEVCRWHYRTKPIYGWGCPSGPTGYWYSFLPIYDPGWQVLMAHGLSTGWIEWRGDRYEFQDAPAYSEKNWGQSFPRAWFWLNCNAFRGEIDLALTAVGGLRQLLFIEEEIGLVGIHHRGRFYLFAPWQGKISWRVRPWGEWEMAATNQQGFRVSLIARTELPGLRLRAPTHHGLKFCCRDTLRGDLMLTLFAPDGTVIIRATSDLCGLEVGGDWLPGGGS